VILLYISLLALFVLVISLGPGVIGGTRSVNVSACPIHPQVLASSHRDRKIRICVKPRFYCANIVISMPSKVVSAPMRERAYSYTIHSVVRIDLNL